MGGRLVEGLSRKENVALHEGGVETAPRVLSFAVMGGRGERHRATPFIVESV
jgi:hypothetical protein